MTDLRSGDNTATQELFDVLLSTYDVALTRAPDGRSGDVPAVFRAARELTSSASARHC